MPCRETATRYIDHPEYVDIIWAGALPSLLPEPSNHAASFSAHNILLNWVDAGGAVLPEGYLIRMSTAGFSSITDPVDGQIYTGPADFTVPFGLQSFRVQNLNPNTTYYFKMYSFSGEAPVINYKTDGTIPQQSQMTTP